MQGKPRGLPPPSREQDYLADPSLYHSVPHPECTDLCVCVHVEATSGIVPDSFSPLRQAPSLSLELTKVAR